MTKNRKAQDVAAAEGVTCTDCIWEALMYARFDPATRLEDARIPTHLMRKFKEALHDEERAHEASHH